MQALTEKGEMKVAEIASRHGVSSAAAAQLLSAIAAGGGRQAQFNHPDLGGMGQWSQGGMIMIGDMFNQGLKARVAALCSDLAEALQEASASFAPEQPDDAPSDRFFAPGAFGQRWPVELGTPASAGSQNDMHYAIFPATRRLAIEHDGQTTVYDTADHRIGGVSQQQGADQTLRFTSQAGVVTLSNLKIVQPAADEGPAPASAAAPSAPAEPNAPDPLPPTDNAGEIEQPAPAPRVAEAPATPAGGSDDEIFSRLERLAELRSRDIITAEEFSAKKAELLARL